MNELEPIKESPFPRPDLVPDHISNAELVQAARSFLYGESFAACALILDMSMQKFTALVRTGQWRELQSLLRDEFLVTTGNRLIRLEQRYLDKIEGFMDEGVEAVAIGKDGEVIKYQRQLNPREAAVIAKTLMETNKRIDRIREGNPGRREFDFNGRIAALERVANAKTVDGEAERAA